MLLKSIFVESEFAPLKRVILAESEFCFPNAKPSEHELDFLSPESRADFENVSGGDHETLFPERHAAWIKERNDFATVLKKYDVEILKPRKLNDIEKAISGDNGYSNFFVRDPVFTIGNIVIEGTMRFIHRRNEIFTVREIIKEVVMEEECTYLSTPQAEIFSPDDSTFGKGPYLEGGDILVLGKHIFVGSSGLASNIRGYEWLAKLLTPFGYTVEYVPLKANILHLDCALSLVRNGLMIVCESVLINGLPDKLKDWARINITESDCAQLAANGLPINELTYVIDPVFARIGDELGNNGITVEAVDFSISRGFGGSFRCSTQPLLRA